MNIERIKEEPTSEEPALKELTITPEEEVKDGDGNLIKKIKLKVFHGVRLAQGKSGISIEVFPESGESVEAGGLRIINGKIIPYSGKIGEDSASPGAQLYRALNTYFEKHPEELAKLEEELKSI